MSSAMSKPTLDADTILKRAAPVKMRIEVGYGLEPTLPDGACGDIIRNVMTPHFKAGNYGQGIGDGVAAIIGRLEGTAVIPRALPAAPTRAPNVRVNMPRMQVLAWPER